MIVLFATDGSPSARLAETLLCRLPHLKGATVHVVSVVPAPGVMMASLQPVASFALIQQADLLWKAHHDHGSKVVGDACERLGAVGFETVGTVLDGDVGPSLLDYAKRCGADLIAVGSRGEGSFKAFFLGSVARRLVAYADVTVLIARDDEGKTAEETLERLESTDKLSIVVAADGSKGADLSIELVAGAGENAFRKGVAVCSEPLSLIPAGLDPVLFAQTYGYDHDEGIRIAGEAADRLKASCSEVVAVARLSKASLLLFECAKEHGADLIVLGANRHGVVERFLLGSVSFEVASEAPCSVLVVRSF